MKWASDGELRGGGGEGSEGENCVIVVAMGLEEH